MFIYFLSARRDFRDRIKSSGSSCEQFKLPIESQSTLRSLKMELRKQAQLLEKTAQSIEEATQTMVTIPIRSIHGHCILHFESQCFAVFVFCFFPCIGQLLPA